jgi:cyclic pyranopterin phosphate synthase
VRDYNDSEDVVDLARLTLAQPWQIRFIEMMPFGSVSEFQKSYVVSEDELISTITQALGPLATVNGGKLDGEARLFQLEGARGTLGFISSVTKPFCAGCSRARLTADGRLRLCLLRDSELDLITPLRSGADDGELTAIIKEAIWWKPWGHGLGQDVIPLNRVMSEIGG